MKLKTEHQLMIMLASGEARREEILEFITSESISWDFLLKEILRNGVGPLAWEALRETNLEQVFPPAFVEGVKRAYQQTAFYNLFLFGETKGVVEHLKKKSIPVILFKGSSLSQEIYKTIALRPCSDVDMLVAKDALEEVKKTFFQLGFAFPKELINERFYYRNHFHIPFSKSLKTTAIEIEVHWNLMDKYLLNPANISEIWDRKKPLVFEGIETYGLSQEDELVYLALHILKHGMMNRWIASRPSLINHLFDPAAENKLIWFVDLQKILRAKGSEIRWDFLIQTAARWGVLESIRPIFILLNALFPSVALPPHFLRQGEPVKVSFPRRILFRTLLAKSQSNFVRKHLLTMKGDLQFRLIRVFDILGYMFPKYPTLSKLYQFRVPFLALFYYPFHIIKTALLGGYGLSQWFLFSLRKPKGVS